MNTESMHIQKKARKQGMSEVYIRSQNREKLYCMGGNNANIEYMEHEGVEKKQHIICISDGYLGLEKIGEYGTKERCLEILDEIQKLCGQYLCAEGSAGLLRGSVAMPPFAAEIPRVYEMPQE